MTFKDLILPLENYSLEKQFFNEINLSGKSIDVRLKGIALITNKNNFSEKIRFCINNFKNHTKNIKTYDFGYYPKKSKEDIVFLIEQLNSIDIIPVFIGFSVDETGLIASETNKSMMQISNQVYNLTHATSYIKSNFLAYQRHLCELDDIHEIENQLYNSMSLGKLRTYSHLTEPVLRTSEIVYINFNALRDSETDEITDALPTGLNSEELCQLMKYAGTANKLSAVFVDSANLSEDNKIMANIIAECIWYLAEGINLRVNDHPTQSTDFSEFVVYSSSIDEDLIFLKHNNTNRWWIKKESEGQVDFLPCSIEEYQSTINDEMTERIQKFLTP